MFFFVHVYSRFQVLKNSLPANFDPKELLSSALPRCITSAVSKPARKAKRARSASQNSASQNGATRNAKESSTKSKEGKMHTDNAAQRTRRRPNLSIDTTQDLDPIKVQNLVSQLNDVQTSSVMKTPNGTVLTPTTRANKHVQLVLALLVRAAELLSLNLSDPHTYRRIPELLKGKVPDSVYEAVHNMAARYASALNNEDKHSTGDETSPAKRRNTNSTATDNTVQGRYVFLCE